MSSEMKSRIALIMEQYNSVTRRGERNEPRTMLKVTRKTQQLNKMLQVAKLLDRELKEQGGKWERAGSILLFARTFSSNTHNSATGKLPRTEERPRKAVGSEAVGGPL